MSLRRPRRTWPDGKKFAFTIVDDTDEATRRNVEPVYALLRDLGLRTTKTVWVFPTDPGDRWAAGETLADDAYRAFVLELQAAGFEIALHGVRGCSSKRDTILEGWRRYEDVLGERPHIHVNHSTNLDNICWGVERLTPWRRALRLHRRGGVAGYGHRPDLQYYWGDLCRAHIDYVRGRCFRGIDTLACDPWMPYHEAHLPDVRAWFSCSDGADVHRFRRLLSLANQDRLETAGGLSIVYTHFGTPGFVDEAGTVDPEVARLLTALAARDGWFRPAGEILDFLAADPWPSLTHTQRARLFLRQRLGR